MFFDWLYKQAALVIYLANATILDKRLSFVKIYSLQVVNTNVQFCGSSTLKGHSYTSLIDIDAVEGIV